MRVLVAPDSFKGSLGAVHVAHALSRGWARARPGDELVLMPQADGGEGTLAVIAQAIGDATWSAHDTATGPHGRPVSARWLNMPDGRAVVELAESSGIAYLDRLDPLGATSRGLGEVIRRTDCSRLTVALGGSASTDGGLGALRALGLEVFDREGRPVPEGGAGLLVAERVDTSSLLSPPADVELLADTSAVLFGPAGAASVFGPQKGADAQIVEELDRGLRRWVDLLADAGLAADPSMPGMGAAGGVAFGLAAAWRARITPGAARVCGLTGLTSAAPKADLIITGEGRFDHTSLTGKIVGHIVSLAAESHVSVVVVAGQVDAGIDVPTYSLTEMAGSTTQAMKAPSYWLTEIGRRAAQRADELVHQA